MYRLPPDCTVNKTELNIAARSEGAKCCDHIAKRSILHTVILQHSSSEDVRMPIIACTI